MTTPTVGRIVHVKTDPKTNNGADVAPAVIVRVWSDTCVNLRMLRDYYPSADEWLTSWELFETREALEAKNGTDGHYGAFWPPRT